MSGSDSGFSYPEATSNDDSRLLNLIMQDNKESLNDSKDKPSEWRSLEAQIQQSLSSITGQTFDHSHDHGSAHDELDGHTSAQSHDPSLLLDRPKTTEDIHNAVINAIGDMNNETQAKETSLLLLDGLLTSALDRLRQVLGLEYVKPAQAQLAALPMVMTAPSNWPLEVQLNVNSLPILDNLATQILRIVVTMSYEEILALLQTPEEGEEYQDLDENGDPIDSPENQRQQDSEAFQALIHMFTYSKGVYTRHVKQFITLEDVAPGIWSADKETPLFISGREELFLNTLRKTNLATFVCGVVGAIEIELAALDMSFLDVFCPIAMCLVLLSENPLKFESEGRSEPGRLLRESAALYLDLKTQAYISSLIQRGSHEAAAEDLEELFPERIREIISARRRELILTPVEEDFVRRCFQRKKFVSVGETGETLVAKYPFDNFVHSLLDFLKRNMAFIVYGGRLLSSTPRKTLWNSEETNPLGDALLEALRRGKSGDIAQALLESLRKRSTDAEMEQEAKKARSESKPKKAPTQKQPRKAWTKTEEEALKAGLLSQGAHWNKILMLYGAGGQINEDLKDRSYVLLKDKARNWKMYYLKRGLPLPDYLQGVTGEVSLSARGSGRSLGKKRMQMRKQGEALAAQQQGP